MPPSSYLFVHFLLILLFFPQHHPAVASRSNIVVDTCKRCSKSSPNVNYTLCVQSLSTYPGSCRANLQGLAIISAKLARSGILKIESEMKEICKNETTSSHTRSCMESCIDMFSDSMANVNDSIRAMKMRRYEDAKTWMSAAVDAPTTCEDEFEEQDVKSPMTRENEHLFQQAIISLAIISLLP